MWKICHREKNWCQCSHYFQFSCFRQWKCFVFKIFFRRLLNKNLQIRLMFKVTLIAHKNCTSDKKNFQIFFITVFCCVAKISLIMQICAKKNVCPRFTQSATNSNFGDREFSRSNWRKLVDSLITRRDVKIIQENPNRTVLFAWCVFWSDRREIERTWC